MGGDHCLRWAIVPCEPHMLMHAAIHPLFSRLRAMLDESTSISSKGRWQFGRFHHSCFASPLFCVCTNTAPDSVAANDCAPALAQS